MKIIYYYGFMEIIGNNVKDYVYLESLVKTFMKRNNPDIFVLVDDDEYSLKEFYQEELGVVNGIRIGSA